MFFPHWGLFFFIGLNQAFLFSQLGRFFFSNWANDFARFLNHDAKIRNPVLSVVR